MHEFMKKSETSAIHACIHVTISTIKLCTTWIIKVTYNINLILSYHNMCNRIFKNENLVKNLLCETYGAIALAKLQDIMK